MLAFASSLLGQSTGTGDISVTAVQGESWIRHLNKSFGETSMGKTWDSGPAPTGPVQATSVATTMDRMKKSGREMSRSDVTAMAKESKVILPQRTRLLRAIQLPAMLSSPALLRTISVEPLICRISFFLKSANSRVTVSRDAPIIWAISS